MDQQHTKIKGYRDLSQDEINLMNRFKQFEAELMLFINSLEATPEEITRKRDLAIAKTHLQTGFMWGVKAIAKPEEIPLFTMSEHQ